MPSGSESMLLEPPGILHKKAGKYFAKRTKREEKALYMVKKGEYCPIILTTIVLDFPCRGVVKYKWYNASSVAACNI